MKDAQGGESPLLQYRAHTQAQASIRDEQLNFEMSLRTPEPHSEAVSPRLPCYFYLARQP